MRLIYKFFILLCLLFCHSCYDADYYGTAHYQASHWINTYVDTNAPQIIGGIDLGKYRIDVEFYNKDNNKANRYYSKEFADVSGKNQSEEQLRKFIQLASKNNDILQWEPWYETSGDSRKNQFYYKGGTLYALTKGIKQIELVSDADFDEEHPAGSSLMDYVNLNVDIYGDQMGKTSLPAEVIYGTRREKMYAEYSLKELSVVGTWFILKLTTLPTLSKNHNFTVAITFDDGEVYTDMVEAKF